MKKLFSFYKRIDPKIKYIISLKGVRSIPLILEMKHGIDDSVIKKLSKLSFKVKHKVKFINHICGVLPVRYFDSLKAMIEIDRIYYDDKAPLMGNIVVKKLDFDNPLQMKSKLLSGRGVSIGFIDTGIHPRVDFFKARRRILAFRDFINDKIDPYDDSGHGTASVAASSIAAYESGIVCAKAFDITNYGYYSDIIAAMDWILELKEKFNIRIVVLNFGTSNTGNNHDILSIASESLWEKGLLVIACSGNFGDERATITSPAHSSKLLTVGSFAMSNGRNTVLSWSSRGPGPNGDKPDLVMPGFVSSESFVGTAASSSIAAGYAALLFEKKKDISPDDAKSLLKLCSVSLKQIKQAQGKGYIDINKIENIE